MKRKLVQQANESMEGVRGGASENAELGTVLLRFFDDFAENAFTQVVESMGGVVGKEGFLEEKEIVHFLWMVGITLHQWRILKKSEVGQVACALELGYVNWVYEIMLRQASQQKKSQFNVGVYHAAAHTFLEMLYVIKEMSLRIDAISRKNALLLMQCIFHHDVTRVLRIGFY